ncbi:MAG: hypothetical protein RIB78_11745 [Gammaproteobacteria bacterium]
MSLEKIAINFAVSDETRKIILEKMNLSELSSPVPGLMIAKWEDEDSFNFKIGFYEKEKIQDGWLITSSINPSELEFYTYQPEILDKLKSGVININEGQVEIIVSD